MVGGDSLQDFAVALLIGISAWTVSSVFLAAPLAVKLNNRASGSPGAMPPEPHSRRQPAPSSGAVF